MNNLVVTLTSEVDTNIKKYLINAIYSEDESIDEMPINDRISYIKKIFELEMFYQKLSKEYSRAECLAKWIGGLPTNLNIDFINIDIERVLKELNIITENSSEKCIAELIYNWFKLLAVKLDELFEGINVPKELN